MHGYWYGGWWLWSFWWLIFPIMGFAFGGFSMWMGYRAHRDRLELMKAYIAQGKSPEEVGKLMEQVRGPGPDGAWDDHGWYGGPWRGRPWRYGRYGRYGPYYEWRRVIIFGCLAGGFWLASQYADFPGTEQAFTLVAIIMGVLAAGALAMALLSTAMSRGLDRSDLTKNGG